MADTARAPNNDAWDPDDVLPRINRDELFASNWTCRKCLKDGYGNFTTRVPLIHNLHIQYHGLKAASDRKQGFFAAGCLDPECPLLFRQHTVQGTNSLLANHIRLRHHYIVAAGERGVHRPTPNDPPRSENTSTSHQHRESSQGGTSSAAATSASSSATHARVSQGNIKSEITGGAGTPQQGGKGKGRQTD